MRMNAFEFADEELSVKMNKKKCGSQVVEFAIMLPLLILIIFWVINWGILLLNKAVLTNAAREGARWASINSTAYACTNSFSATPSDPCQSAFSYASKSLITFSNSVPTACYGTLNSDGTACGSNQSNFTQGQPQTVGIYFTFTGLSVAFSNYGSSLTGISNQAGNLSATSVMIHE